MVIHTRGRSFLLLVLCIGVVGCEADASPASEAKEPPPKLGPCGLREVSGAIEVHSWQQGDPTGGAKGRLVLANGAPMVGAGVLACTAHTCFTTETDSDGRYAYGTDELPAVPHKMQVLPPTTAHASLIWHQDIKAGATAVLPRDIVVMAVTEKMTPWPAATGGKVVLAQGALHLTVAPKSLEYPLGTPDDQQAVVAVKTELAQVPVFDQPYWRDSNEPAFAYALNPFYLKSSSSIGVKLTGTKLAPGSKYCILSPAPADATLKHLGDAAANEEGDLVAGGDLEVKWLTTLIFVAKTTP